MKVGRPPFRISMKIIHSAIHAMQGNTQSAKKRVQIFTFQVVKSSLIVFELIRYSVSLQDSWRNIPEFKDWLEFDPVLKVMTCSLCTTHKEILGHSHGGMAVWWTTGSKRLRKSTSS